MKMKRILAGALALLMLAGCGAKAEIKSDDAGDYVLTSQPEASDAAEIEKIEEIFLTALKNKNTDELKEQLDPEVPITEETLKAFLESAAGEGMADYKKYDSYYLSGLTKSDISIRAKKSDDSKDYIMFTPASDELYAALYASENEYVSQVITLLFSKVSGKWKIVWIDSTDLAYNGEKADFYYEKSKAARESGQEMLAYIYVQMMYNISQPGRLYYYEKTEEMLEYANEMSVWGETNFPVELPTGNVYLVGIAREETGIVPMFLYHTAADITNAEAFREDAIRAKKEFLKKYPEIAENFSKITVRATNVDPTTATEEAPIESIVLDMK